MNFSSETDWGLDKAGDNLSEELLRKIKKNQKSQLHRHDNKKKKKNRIQSSKVTQLGNNGKILRDSSKKMNRRSLGSVAQVQTESKKSPRVEPLEQTQRMKQNHESNDNQKLGSKKIHQNKKNIRKTIDLQKVQQLLSKKNSGSTNKTSIREMSLRERMMEHLRASRFRFLNETLYNNESSESNKLFQKDPDSFNAYHDGYRQQVKQWPLNPVDIIIKAIKKMPKEYIIADFGCGEAKLADSVEQKVHSFDLVAVNNKVIACDMAHTQLTTNSVNVVVFCLSLMGSNLSDYLIEANRVLVQNGILKIADIESRFDNVEEFMKLLEKYGFKNTWKDLSFELFYFMDFEKIQHINRKSGLPQVSLKSCSYKKR